MMDLISDFVLYPSPKRRWTLTLQWEPRFFNGHSSRKTSNLGRAGEDEPTRLCSRLVRHKPRTEEKASRGRDGKDRAGLGGPKVTTEDDLDLGQTLVACLAGTRRQRARGHPVGCSPQRFSDSQFYSRLYGGRDHSIG